MIEQVIGASGQISTSIGSNTKTSGVDLGKQFNHILEDAMANIGAQQQEVTQLNKMFEAGQLPDVHNLLIAAEQSAIHLELTVQIRNKVIEAYQEIMRTQL